MPILPFEAWQTVDLPVTEIVSARNRLAHDLFLAFPYEVRNELPTADDDLVVLIDKANARRRFQELAAYPGRAVVVSAPHDLPLGRKQVPKEHHLPSNVAAAYGTNVELGDRRAIPVPLGVRPNHLTALQSVRQGHGGERRGLLYGSFAISSAPGAMSLGSRFFRSQVAEQLSGEPWADLDVFEGSRQGLPAQLEYYSEIASHRFVLSPPGGGADCYRTWESIYLGAIPIVVAGPAMSAFADLPILFTENYSELSERYLEEQWERMSAASYEVEKALKAHYFSHFLTSIATLSQPRFVYLRDDGFPQKLLEEMERSFRSTDAV